MTDLIARLTQVSLSASVLGLALAAFFYFRVKALPEGTDTMNMIARYIRERTAPGDRIAVIGSEPEIYFYAERNAATGHL